MSVLTTAAPGFGARFGLSAASTAVISERPLIRCAAQSAEISVHFMPQTFSV